MPGSPHFSRLLEGSLAAISSVRDLEGPVVAAGARLAAALQQGRRVLACGNGGSAAEAAHFATELLCRLCRDRRPLPAINLSADGSFLTAAGNDYPFEEVFSRQVTGLGERGDVLVAFSTSGKSPNILRALEAARTAGLGTIALLGRDGGPAAGLAEIPIVVPAQDTMHIQEAHQVILHMLCVEIEAVLFPDLWPPHAADR